MAENAQFEDVLHNLRAIGSALSARLSHLLGFFVKYKNVSSLGAVAGFAIAIFCTWRYVHNLRRRRQRLNKPPNAGPTSHGAGTSRRDDRGNTDSSTVRVASESEHFVTRSVQRGQSRSAEATFAAEVPVQHLSLEKVVRRQLNGGRRITCQVLGVVLEQTEASQLKNGAFVRQSSLGVVKELARATDLYLMARVDTDEQEAMVMSALEEAGLFEGGLVNRNKVLFCSTEIGIMSFVRQLEPDWHVDSSQTTVQQLARFLRHQLWIAPPGSPTLAQNVLVSPSIENYFGLSF